MTIENIIKQCLKGDEKSQYKLYRYCFDLLMPTCIRFKDNEHDALSSLNKIYLKILDKAYKKKSDVNFNHWAQRMAVNQLIDEYRKDKRRYSLFTQMDSNELESVSRAFTLNINEYEIEAEELLRIIQQLSEPGRTVFNLHALEGFSHDEIAEKLGMTTENSRYHLHASRKILHKKLSKTSNYSKLA